MKRSTPGLMSGGASIVLLIESHIVSRLARQDRACSR